MPAPKTYIHPGTGAIYVTTGKPPRGYVLQAEQPKPKPKK